MSRLTTKAPCLFGCNAKLQTSGCLFFREPQLLSSRVRADQLQGSVPASALHGPVLIHHVTPPDRLGMHSQHTSNSLYVSLHIDRRLDANRSVRRSRTPVRHPGLSIRRCTVGDRCMAMRDVTKANSRNARLERESRGCSLLTTVRSICVQQRSFLPRTHSYLLVLPSPYGFVRVFRYGSRRQQLQLQLQQQ